MSCTVPCGCAAAVSAAFPNSFEHAQGTFAAHPCDSNLASSHLQLVAEGVRRDSAVITRPTALHQSFLQNMLVH